MLDIYKKEYETIGQRIKESAKLRSKSQAEIAEAVGVSQPSVNEWANGGTKPSIESFRLLSNFLEVDILWLMYGNGKLAYQVPDEDKESEVLVRWSYDRLVTAKEFIKRLTPLVCNPVRNLDELNGDMYLSDYRDLQTAFCKLRDAFEKVTK